RLERLRTGIRSGLIDRFAGSEGEGPAWSGLALALLLGIRDNLDSGLTSLYRGAGISYILALSGMHLAVIIALLSLLLKKPLGLRAATVAGMLIIVAYCLLVGPLPSLYRSALMYLLGAFAVLGMLRRDSLSILAMAFVLQLSLDPQSGLSLSFILSYLAMVGILVLGKALNDLLAGLIPRFFLGPLSLSLGAFIGTAAAVLWFFGELRPVGILAGLIVAPLTTAFMVLALAWLCIPPLAVPIAALLALLYDAMESTARLAAHVPNLSAPPALAIPLSLALLIFLPALAAFLRRRRNRLDPFD
ncbi:MAG: ComEC/Rec2 family competence protein, partial [Treponema sp.]|nr:ComEC/Rec2 family competence protein [Treponema sp.]